MRVIVRMMAVARASSQTGFCPRKSMVSGIYEDAMEEELWGNYSMVYKA